MMGVDDWGPVALCPHCHEPYDGGETAWAPDADRAVGRREYATCGVCRGRFSVVEHDEGGFKTYTARNDWRWATWLPSMRFVWQPARVGPRVPAMSPSTKCDFLMWCPDCGVWSGVAVGATSSARCPVVGCGCARLRWFGHWGMPFGLYPAKGYASTATIGLGGIIVAEWYTRLLEDVLFGDAPPQRARLFRFLRWMMSVKGTNAIEVDV